MHADVPGVHQQLLAGAQGLGHHFAREVEEHRAGAGHLLQDEARAAEEARADALLPGQFDGDRFLRAQERLLAADQRLAGRQLARQDGAGKARREGHVAAPVGAELGDEEAAAGQAALEPGQQAAAGMGVHPHPIGHPRHGGGLAVDHLAGRKVDAHGLHRGAGNLVAHACKSIFVAAKRQHSLSLAAKRGLVWRLNSGAPAMDDSLSLFELPQALVKPALEICRTFNSALDLAFYDVPTLIADLHARGAAPIDLGALANPEGALLVVDSTRAPFIRRFEALPLFNAWRAYADATPKIVSITGVGSSALGSAAMAWDLSKALAAPVLAIVPGYGVADALLQGLGGWFGFGLYDALQTKSRLQDTLAFMTPQIAGVGRNLVGSLPDTKRINGAPVFRTGCGSSDVLHALMGEIVIKCVVGHSKGALAIANALNDLDLAETDGLRIVTLGCPVPESLSGATYHQCLGLFDALGQANAWGNPPDQWTPTDHSTNTALPL